MGTPDVVVRAAGPEDFDGWFDLFEAVAAEGRWIGRELPVDPDVQRRRFVDGLAQDDGPAIAFVAESGDRQVGQLFLRSRIGIGDIGMAVAAEWRGQGVGTALMKAAVGWAKEQGLHKLELQLWPHNQAALKLYQRFGFVEEGRLLRHYRWRNGELWDALIMGLVLDTTSPGSGL